MTIDLAQPSDAAPVEALLDNAAQWQRSRGIKQWRPGQFGDEVRRTIAGGYLFVARTDEALLGCFMLDVESPDWIARWLIEQGRSTEGAHLGRLAVAREASGTGLGESLLSAACGLAADRGLRVLRLDCPAENARLCRYYLDAGFSHLGDIPLSGPNGERWVSSVFEISSARARN